MKNWETLNLTERSSALPPQPHLNGRLPRGKGLGGSSILNIMGNAKEYDAFEALGSHWMELAITTSIFQKASPQELSEMEITPNPNVHGSDGPLQVSVLRWVSDTAQPFRSALELLGVLRNPDSVRRAATRAV
ncbi:hypothetical protein JOM56_005459 [Amanita muscaria]